MIHASFYTTFTFIVYCWWWCSRIVRVTVVVGGSAVNVKVAGSVAGSVVGRIVGRVVARVLLLFV